MAIERMQENDGEMDYSAPEPGEESETVDIPLSMLGGKTANPGDVVRLEVVSVNEDSGTLTAKYATEKPMRSSISEAARKFEA